MGLTQATVHRMPFAAASLNGWLLCDANPALARLAGADSPDALRGRDVRELVTEPQRLEQGFEQAQRLGSTELAQLQWRNHPASHRLTTVTIICVDAAENADGPAYEMFVTEAPRDTPPPPDSTGVDEALFYRELVEKHPHMVCRFLPDTTITFANQAYAEFFGFTPETMQGVRWIERVPVEAWERLFGSLECLTPDNPVESMENFVECDDGSLRWTRWTNRAFHNSQGETLYFQCVGTDITKKREAQQQLEEANRVKSDFLAAVSHDLRTPLNAIFGYTDLLARSPLNPDQLDYVHRCRSAGQNLLVLVDMLLELSRIESGYLTLHPAPFGLEALVRSQLDVFEHMATEKGLELCMTIDETLPACLEGDRDRIGQILNNLISNALKFSAEGRVEVRAASSTPGWVNFQVIDSGSGIPESELDTIFEPFSQGSAGMKDETGSGLGLRICHELVRLMGGRISAGNNPGSGACFTVALPLPAAQSGEEPVGTAMEAPGYSEELRERALAVLVAEDDTMNATLIQMMLENEGCTVELVRDGHSAYQRALEGIHDLVLMDVSMPEMPGDEATAAIRREEQARGLRRTPIVALSAHAVDDVRNRLIEAGCDDYLTKPVAVASLQALLRSYLPKKVKDE